MKTNYLIGVFVFLTLIAGIAWLIFDWSQLEPVTIILGSLVAILESRKVTTLNKKAGVLLGVIGIGFFVFGISTACNSSAPAQTEFSTAVTRPDNESVHIEGDALEIEGDMTGSTIIQSGGGDVVVGSMPTAEPTPYPVCTVKLSDYFRGGCTWVWETPDSMADRLDCLPEGATVTVDSTVPSAFLAMYHVVRWEYEGGPIYITEVRTDSPAEVAGIQVGDRIVSFDGQAIETIPNLPEYSQAHAGETIIVELERNGEVLEVVVDSRSNPPPGEGPIGFINSGSFGSGAGENGYVAVSSVACK